MKISYDKLAKLATITIECEPEACQIEGNASAIDDETDRATYEWIRDQLDRGNEWAWCCVVVRATYAGLEGADSLGCCSYMSEADFKVGGYYADMCREAMARLADTLEASYVAISAVTS